MASTYFIPFNHEPVSIGTGTTSYTVPTGKYARVSISVSGVATTYSTTASQTYAVSTNFNETLELWLRPGAVVAVTLTNATGGAPTTKANIQINSVAAAEFFCRVPDIGTMSASSFSYIYAEEYNEIT